MKPAVPYALVALGLVSGLAVLLSSPLPSPALNRFLAGALLALAGASLTYLIARASGPGERGPDF